MDDYNAKYQLWVEKATDEEVKAQLAVLSKDQIKENFYCDLSFGTAGLRGELGAGTNCLNVYTIRKATQGVAECMKAHGHTVASVSCDSRINSQLFARTTAEVFASNGIKTYLTRELMPTPFLSYLTRETGSQVGVMITASHNPAKYNGYKVYGSDGCQLTDNYANEMTDYIAKIDPFEVKTLTVEEYEKQGLIEYASDDVIEKYLQTVHSHANGTAEGIKITYSPLNGAGYKLVPEILRRIKADRIDIVAEQAMPDGNFTTCSYPNPEKAEALALGMEAVKENGSDILIATDPDCDRVGIAVPVENGYRLMTGNEVGVLLTDYLLATKKEQGILPERPVIVKTIVTSELIRKVIAPYNAELFDVLTGFKYIGAVIAKLEEKGEENRYILGFEESYGYLSGTYVRDKDGVVASMLIAEMTAYYKKQGKTLVDRLNEIYAQYGLYEHKQVRFDFPGSAGIALMNEILQSVRENMPTQIAGMKVIKAIDYLTQTEFDLPPANVLSFSLKDGSQLIMRPSGTEPIVKIYLTACKDEKYNAEKFAQMTEYLNTVFVK